MGLFPIFLEKSSNKWQNDDNYQYFYDQLKFIKVVNDAAERALGLVTEFHNNKVTCNKEQQEFLYRNVKFMREEQKKLARKRKEKVTKDVLIGTIYLNKLI